MILSFRARWGLALGLCLALSASPARAESISYILTPFTGDPAQVRLTLDDTTTAGAITFTVQLVSGTTADLRGVFFNFTGDPGTLTITGPHVTSVQTAGVTDLGHGANIHPEGPFDIGVEIGTQGIGQDDIASTTFTVAGPSLTLAQFTTETDPVTPDGELSLLFAVRLTSVGADREGSSKLGVSTDTPPTPGSPPISSTPPVHTPEPLSLVLWGLAALGFAGCARQARRQRPV
jgi:hypothetical protein